MEENKLKKILYNEVTFILAIISIVFGFISWITNPREAISQRVGSLEQTIEYQSDSLEEIKTKVNIIDSRQVDILQAIARLQAEHK